MPFGETLVAMTAVVLGCTIVIIPVAGLTARFAMKPLLESWNRARNVSGENGQQLAILERRVSILEQQVEVLDRDNTRLLDEAEFRERLAHPLKEAAGGS